MVPPTRPSTEVVVLLCTQVIVDLLPGDADPAREGGRRGGLGQLRQQHAADRIECADRRGRIGDDLDVDMDSILSLDK